MLALVANFLTRYLTLRISPVVNVLAGIKNEVVATKDKVPVPTVDPVPKLLYVDNLPVSKEAVEANDALATEPNKKDAVVANDAVPNNEPVILPLTLNEPVI